MPHRVKCIIDMMETRTIKNNWGSSSCQNLRTTSLGQNLLALIEYITTKFRPFKWTEPSVRMINTKYVSIKRIGWQVKKLLTFAACYLHHHGNIYKTNHDSFLCRHLLKTTVTSDIFEKCEAKIIGQFFSWTAAKLVQIFSPLSVHLKS